jgi:hypothetical protein
LQKFAKNKIKSFGGYDLDELPSFYGVGISRDIFCVHLLCFEYTKVVDFRRYRLNGATYIL